MLTVKHAADRLNVSIKLIYALCASGRLEHVRYGLGRGTIRISEEALRRFQDDSKVENALKALPQLNHLNPPMSSH
jgi:excisionase family DNA binding protein